MTCNDCLHRKACGDELEECAEKCKFFLNRDEYVRVVRCKDCAFATDEGMSGIYCDHPDHRNPVGCRETDFCDEGIRRDDLPEEEEEEEEELTEEVTEACARAAEAISNAANAVRMGLCSVCRLIGEGFIELSKAYKDSCEEENEGTYSAAEEDAKLGDFKKLEGTLIDDGEEEQTK